ncbi:hypothetical protein [Ideonella sp.]|uniref:hypothetical protein n=1 Tax=Ideonella sp. TaxID=1929293 RepID=UPI0035AF8115
MATPTLQPPSTVRASALMHGSPSDFVINAYLALQRQWPDGGGFGHYLHLLEQQPGARAQVLREIAASPTARRCGVRFVDDLPEDHVFLPEHHESHKLVEMSLALRLAQAVADIRQLQASVGQLTEHHLSRALNAFVEAHAGAQCLLESRVNTLAADVRELGRAAAQGSLRGAGPLAAAPADPEAASWRAEVDAGLARTTEALGQITQQLAELREGFFHLHHYTTVELKRQVADYVNAIVEATRPRPVLAAEPAAGRARAAASSTGAATPLAKAVPMRLVEPTHG